MKIILHEITVELLNVFEKLGAKFTPVDTGETDKYDITLKTHKKADFKADEFLRIVDIHREIYSVLDEKSTAPLHHVIELIFELNDYLNNKWAADKIQPKDKIPLYELAFKLSFYIDYAEENLLRCKVLISLASIYHDIDNNISLIITLDKLTTLLEKEWPNPVKKCLFIDIACSYYLKDADFYAAHSNAVLRLFTVFNTIGRAEVTKYIPRMHSIAQKAKKLSQSLPPAQTGEIKLLSQEIKTTSTGSDKFTRQLAHLNQQIEVEKKKSTSLKQEIENAHLQLEQNQQQHTAYLKKLEQAHADEKNKIDQETKQLEVKLTELNITLTTLKQSNQSFKKEFRKQKAELSSQIATLKKELEQLTIENANKKRTLSEFKNQHQVDSLSALKEKVAASLARIEALNREKQIVHLLQIKENIERTLLEAQLKNKMIKTSITQNMRQFLQAEYELKMIKGQILPDAVAQLKRQEAIEKAIEAAQTSLSLNLS